MVFDIDASLFDDIVGNTANVYTVDESTNDYGDVTRTKTGTTEVTCEIQIMSGEDREVRHGILKPMDAIGFFKPDVSIEIGDIVGYGGEDYKVIGLFTEGLGTVSVFQEAHLSKILE